MKKTRDPDRELCRRWFIAGFAVSGQGLNGECVDPRKHGGAVSLLETEFDRLFAQRREE